MKKPIRLNLGCGMKLIDGFVNVDSCGTSDAPNFKNGDIRALPFDANYADYILMDNVLEHLPMADVPTALHEVRRVLKVGGRAVIIVPDFSALARAWLEFDALPSFNPYIYQWIGETIYGNQWHEGEYHRTPMSPGFLNYILRLAGFRKFTLTKCTAGGQMPQDLPGVDPLKANEVLRNDQLVADVEKTA